MFLAHRNRRPCDLEYFKTHRGGQIRLVRVCAKCTEGCPDILRASVSGVRLEISHQLAEGVELRSFAHVQVRVEFSAPYPCVLLLHVPEPGVEGARIGIPAMSQRGKCVRESCVFTPREHLSRGLQASSNYLNNESLLLPRQTRTAREKLEQVGAVGCGVTPAFVQNIPANIALIGHRGRPE